MTTVDTTSRKQLPSAGAWTLDPSHSSVEFEVRHLMVSKVRGGFTNFAAEVFIGDDISDSRVTASVDLASIDTGDAKRDEHLRSTDFFDVDKNSQLTFVSRSLIIDGDEYRLQGDLTFAETTVPVTFDLELGGVAKDPWGGTRLGITATATISRKALGLEWNVALESGGVLVGDKVKVILEVQLIQA